jgi:predicted Zn-dependent protease
MQMRLLPIVIGVIAISVMLARGCQEGPFGRKQIVALSAQEEAALGAQAFRQVLSDAELVPEGALADAVQEVAARLAHATQNPEFLRLVRQPPQEMEWRLSLVRSEECNAFCLPGGKIVVYTGILLPAETDAGLATVIGHEIAHALAHHGAERMAQTQLAQIGSAALGAAIGGDDLQKQREVMMILNAGAKFGILAYSRGHESEADHMGLLLMAAAGYDPRESVRFWERMQDDSQGPRPPEFLSTHPSHATRIQQLTAWIPEAMPLYEASKFRRDPELLPGEL